MMITHSLSFRCVVNTGARWWLSRSEIRCCEDCVRNAERCLIFIVVMVHKHAACLYARHPPKDPYSQGGRHEDDDGST